MMTSTQPGTLGSAPALQPYRPTAPIVGGIALLEASAGTGKTYSIADLYTRLIAEDGLDVRRILVVTFTDAATAELRARVRRRLGEAAEALETAAFDPQAPEPKEVVLAHLVARARDEGLGTTFVRRLAAARESFDEAAIFTIHGFCQRTLQRNAFESGADFDLELTDDLPLLTEAIDDFLVRELHDLPLDLVAFLQGRRVHRAGLQALGKLVLLHPDAAVEPDPPTEPFAAVVAREWRPVTAALQARWSSEGAELFAALQQACATGLLSGAKFKPVKLQEAHAAVTDWLARGAPVEAEVLEALAFFGADKIQSSLNKGKSLPPHAISALCAGVAQAQARLTAAADRVRTGFCAFLGPQLQHRKQQRQLQSFSDMLRQLQQGLTGEHRAALRRGIRAQFQAALIDEFQDTDPVQWQIFHDVFGQAEDDEPLPPLVLIGDPKQAIYGFRGADLHTYLTARAEASAGQHTLDMNFRSDGPLVVAVQHLFGGELPFADPRIALPAVRPAQKDARVHPPQPALTLRFLSTARIAHTVDPVGPDPGEVLSGEAKPVDKKRITPALGQHLAQDVVDLLTSGTEIDVKVRRLQDGVETEVVERRPVRPGDIAVLVRRNQEAVDLQHELARRGVPGVLSSSGDVFASASATAFAALLAAIADPEDTGRLCVALSTPLIGLDAAGLARLQLDDAQRQAWGDRQRAWLAEWRDHGFVRAIRAVLASRCARDPLAPDGVVSIPERLLTLPDGERGLTDLLHLVELTQAAALHQGLNPQGVLTWLTRQRAGTDERDETRELRLETDAAAVQLVTIHKCKGLQYPFVFCPSAWEVKQDVRAENLVFHDPDRDEALTLDLRSDAQAEPKAGHTVIAGVDSLAEALRVLYVAFTRAQHRTFVYLGNLKDYPDSALAWLLHRNHAGDPTAPAVWIPAVQAYVAALTEQQLHAEVVEALQDCPSAAVELVGPLDLGKAWVETADQRPVLSARVFRGPRPDPLWRRASYSSLGTRGRPTVDDAPEQQQFWKNADFDVEPDASEPVAVSGPGAGPAADLPVPDDAPDVPLDQPLLPGVRFVPSEVFGNFVHAIFEHHDFQGSADALRTEVAEQQRRHGLGVDIDRVTAGLDLVLDTPLGAMVQDRTLRAVAKSQRLTELRFDFPLVGADGAPGSVSSGDLADVLRRNRGPGSPLTDAYLDTVARMGFAPLRGFLNGSIDLVFRLPTPDGERWFLADYKTNWLGSRDPRRCTAWHYQPAALHVAMRHGHYFLQYHLYAVALHRWLSWRLPGYDYDRHFGGGLYLFVRGMVGGDAGLPPELRPGVFADRPDRGLILALSELLRLGGGGAGVG
jgi:exodeoxyribonuclease V beta subunit